MGERLCVSVCDMSGTLLASPPVGYVMFCRLSVVSASLYKTSFGSYLPPLLFLIKACRGQLYDYVRHLSESGVIFGPLMLN